MRYLTLAEVLYIHEQVLAQTGGRGGIRDLAALESAMGQPKVSVGGSDGYRSVEEKASALQQTCQPVNPLAKRRARGG
jgi:death-on-curing protein